MVASIGILLPSREVELGSGANLRDLVDLAVTAESAGLDHVWVGDSPVARPRAEPFTLLGAVAGRTETIGLGTAALIPALRHPLHTAHAIASLDQLAPGRATLAVGAGFPYDATREEFAEFGVPWNARNQRLDDIVGRWRSLWTEDDSALPKPTTPGGPPIWLAAGASPANAARLAKTYDGWLPYVPDPKAYRPMGGEAGLYVTLTLGPEAEAAATQEAYLQAYYGFGSAVMGGLQACHAGEPDTAAKFLVDYINAGARHLVIRLGAFDVRPQLRLLVDEVVPALR